jgi:1-acyl-sn-glycerol-3-phosphate acyltransferase
MAIPDGTADNYSGFYFFVRSIVGWIMRLVGKTTVLGAENVPPGGSFLFAANHLSQIDSPLCLAVIPRQMRVFSAVKYRSNPFLRFLFEHMGCIWVRQFEADHQALREALQYLKGGGTLAIAPEGTRSRETHALLPGRGGAALLASRSGVWILPTAIWGTDTFVRDLQHFRRGRAFVRIGKPFRLDVSPRAKGAELDAATDEIMCAIAALLPPQYRGVYADHPRLKAWLEKAGG